jgi:hypothetical protein
VAILAGAVYKIHKNLLKPLIGIDLSMFTVFYIGTIQSMNPGNAPLKSNHIPDQVRVHIRHLHYSQGTEKVDLHWTNSSSILMMNRSHATRGRVSSKRF